MKLMEKTVIGSRINLQWKMEEVKTEKACLKVALATCKLGELVRVECRGYEDMDEHENHATFETQKEFAENLDKIRKIDADRIEVYLNVDGATVSAVFGPCSDDENGNWVTVFGKEDAAKKLSSEIKKLIG